MCFAMTGPQSISPGIELLPCPFCGETDVGFGHTGQKWQTVACNECGAEGPCTEIDRDLIVQKWNARALQPATTTAGQVWCEPCGHHVMPEQIAECCAEPCALATGGDAVAGEAKAAEDIIISYFDSHGINDARAGAFNILDRLREAGLTVTAIRSPDEAATPPHSAGIEQALRELLRCPTIHETWRKPAVAALAAAQSEREPALVEFFKWAMREGPWEGGDLDGGSIQDKAESLGLIVRTKFDPEKHGTAYGDFSEGDDYYEFAPGVSLPSTEGKSHG
jgi:Lar family restriction alleviation protein